MKISIIETNTTTDVCIKCILMIKILIKLFVYLGRQGQYIGSILLVKLTPEYFFLIIITNQIIFINIHL